eukprot:RCo000725
MQAGVKKRPRPQGHSEGTPAAKPATQAAARAEIGSVFSALSSARKDRKAAASTTLPTEEEPQRVAASEPTEKGKASPPLKKAKKPGKAKGQMTDEEFFDIRGGKGEGRWVDGLRVYTEEELGLTTGGGNTPLCPFDCDCCH